MLNGRKKKSIINFNRIEEIYETVVKSGNPVLPVVVQDIESGEVLMCACMSRKTLMASLWSKKAIFWSVSKNALWIKGETSGCLLEIVKVKVDCEGNSLLFQVKLKGEGACHVKDFAGRFRKSCFYRFIADFSSAEFVLHEES